MFVMNQNGSSSPLCDCFLSRICKSIDINLISKLYRYFRIYSNYKTLSKLIVNLNASLRLTNERDKVDYDINL